MPWPILQVGTILGDKSSPTHYKIVAELGGGGFGQVYKVHHEKLDLHFAFKTPKPNLERERQHLDDFIQEARTWARLPVHENLVQAKDLFFFNGHGDRPFLSLEFVAGGSLQSILAAEKGRLAPAQVVSYASGVCQGMKRIMDQEVHGSVLIHRDISPDNVLVHPLNNTPKITDFGLARVEGNVSLNVAGKWRFMAPEVVMCQGWSGVAPKKVDRRADIYSFGVMAYVLLTGQFPLDANVSMLEFQNAILNKPPHEIRSRLETDAKSTPGKFLDLVMQCLKKAPGERPQTWDAILDDLLAVQDEAEKAPNYRLCDKCGFRSRTLVLAPRCPVCGNEKLLAPGQKGVAPGSLGDLGTIYTDPRGKPVPARQLPPPPPPKPTLLRVPAGKSVIGANASLLPLLAERAAKDRVPPEAISRPAAAVVELPPFEIGRTPVTEEEFDYFLRESRYAVPNRPRPSGQGLPVVNVTFAEAEAFCDWSGGRLPTAAEWEKAARGVDGRAYPWGNEFDPARCTSAESHARGPSPVLAHPTSRSPFGLFDCVGNVGEMVDGGSSQMKPVLGGSFPEPCRYRGLLWTRLCQISATYRSPAVGFRMAKEGDATRLAAFEERFVPVAGQACVGCDEALLPILECQAPLSPPLLESLRKNKLRVVTLEPFEIGVYTITNEQYAQYIKATGKPAPKGWAATEYAWSDRRFLKKYAHHPVVHVRHDDALAYCRWRSDRDPQFTYRLPRRDEWEVAARGAERHIFPWGDDYSADRCNGSDAPWGRTVDVREYPQGDSPAGCRQMTGNVFEWLQDTAGNARFMRGGAFQAACEIYGLTFFEMGTEASYQADHVGFRLVRIKKR
ncbi:MAG: bifunctional serine/threonine-protein kinase/formylglycine-generating enzyme family protein [Pirellulaceae bacterium]|nr:bifunctional serine/threonine-protein kinase/formylglycine-generating enzyme family protein [Pirellulaceae bacterium]